MNSSNKMIKTFFVSFLVVTFAGVVNLATGMIPSMQSANAIDVDLADFKCFGMFNSCETSVTNNSVDNSNSNNDNSINDSYNDNSVDNTDDSQDNDVTISDSFNPANTCGNNSANATFSNNTVSCNNDFGSAITPSTLDLMK